MVNAVTQCMCCAGCFFGLIAIIFVIMSFSSLPVNTYGLDYSPITKEIADTPLTSGYHWIGFMHKFIEYPSQMQTFDFSDNQNANRGFVEARSKDGLMVNFRA